VAAAPAKPSNELAIEHIMLRSRTAGGETMVQLTSIIGFRDDSDVAERLHVLGHQDRVEEIVLAREDLARRRLRAVTSKGAECLISLPRQQRLKDGAVLLLEEARAIVVRARPERWITFEPADAAAALELGYFAGNMHWRVRFDGGRLGIGVEEDKSFYLARLGPLLAARRIARRDNA
jgi:urease accessory protein